MSLPREVLQTLLERLTCLCGASFLILLLAACQPLSEPVPASHAISGTVTGLDGAIVLKVGNELLSLGASGAFKFRSEFFVGNAYNVVVHSAPVGQSCEVRNGSGVVNGPVSNVVVSCGFSSYSLGGTVSGLTGTVVLSTGSEDLTVVANLPFTFLGKVGHGSSYAVVVKTQPAAQACTVTNGTGVATATVSNLVVTCVTKTYGLGGSVSGLSGTLILKNGADNLTLTANGPFTFREQVAYGRGYTVLIDSQPSGLECVVSDGVGTIAAAVSNVGVSCVPRSYSLGGRVSGLVGTVILSTGLEDLTVVSNLPFTFLGKVKHGSGYTVVVKTQPVGQVCTVANGVGTAVEAVTGIAVSCVNLELRVGGTVTGLAAGSSVVLRNSNGDRLTITANGSFSFPTVVEQGAAYSVVVDRQDAGLRCVVGGGAGTVGTTVTPVVVSCGYLIGVAVSNLSGEVILQNNDGDDLTVTSTGNTVYFPTAVAAGLGYAVTVKRDPAAQACTVTQGTGTAPPTVVAQVSCAVGYALSGVAAGLAGGGSLVLQNGDGDSLTLTQDGRFSFSRKVSPGAGYSVVVGAQPTQATCVVSNGAGTMATVEVTGIRVSCSQAPSTATALLKQVDMVQTLSQSVNSKYQLLVPGRSALVRAYAYRKGGASPAVTVKVNDNMAVNMTCPAVLPDAPVTLDALPLYAYDHSTVCYFTVPASEVYVGMRVVVESGGAVSGAVVPVGSSSKITLYLVPVNVNGVAPAMPTDEVVKAELLKRFPLKDVTIQRRAAYTPLGLNYQTNVGGEDQWSALLGEVRLLQQLENSEAFYYGLVPFNCATFLAGNGGVLGIGYVGNGRPLAALGVDTRLSSTCMQSASWLQTLVHELGHNLSLLHAPCGNPSSVDPAWYGAGVRVGDVVGTGEITWANASIAALSKAAVYDGANLANPLESSLLAYTFTNRQLYPNQFGKDAMAYCSGVWFSEYNYYKMADYLSVNDLSGTPAAANLAQVQAFAGRQMLHVAGEVKAGVIALDPLMVLQDVPESKDRGDYVLRLETLAGGVVERRFTPLMVADWEDDVSHFSLILPDPGPLKALVISKGGKVLFRRAVSEALAQPLGLDRGVQLREVEGRLQLSWNSQSYPFLSLSHIDGQGQRQVLLIHARGGSAEVGLEGVAAGGVWEISQSDGLRSKVERRARD